MDEDMGGVGYDSLLLTREKNIAVQTIFAFVVFSNSCLSSFKGFLNKILQELSYSNFDKEIWLKFVHLE